MRTKSRQELEAPRLGENYFRQLIEASLDPLVTLDRDGKITDVNPATEAATGRKRTELIGTDFSDYFSKPENAHACYRQAFRAGLVRDYPLELRQRDGSIIPFLCNASVYKDARGGVIGAFADMRDVSEQKRVEAALKESEEKFRHVFESSPLGKSLTRVSGEVSVNRAFCELLGYSAPELENKKWQDISHPDDVEMTNREIAPLLTGEKSEARFRKRYLHKTGAVIWAELSTTLRRDAAGQPLYFITTVNDITERVRLDIALRESEERFRVAAASANDVVYEWDLKQRVQWFGKIDEMLGYPPGGFSRDFDGFVAAVHPDDRANLIAAIQAHLEARAPYAVEYRVRRRNGENRWWSARGVALRTPDGKPLRWIGSITDITAPKEADLALRASEQRLRRFYESSLVGIIYWNMRGQILDANDKFLDMTGYTRDELTSGRIDWQNMTPPEFRHLDEKSVAELKATGVNQRPFEKEYLRKDGTRLPILLAGAMLDEARENGVAFVLDIAARKQAEAEIKRLCADLDLRVRERTLELEAANKELEAFCYSVSHDLRAPLRAMDGFSKIALGQHAHELSPEVREALRIVRDSAQQMAQLINDLLEFSRLSRQPVLKSHVSPRPIVDECLETLEASWAGRRVEFCIGELPTCRGDAGLLRLVWINLLSNALKFSRPRDPARIEIGSRHNGETVYYVRDNGVGFKMAYSDKLFSVFQRLHRAEDFEGTGVGLATAQRIIQRHGGRIWAEAQLNKGATFFFTLEPPINP